jgi:phage tail protein X
LHREGAYGMGIYTTIQGDVWDSIAWKLYGDEKYMKNLIEANWDYIDVVVFSSGTVLNVPDIPDEEIDGVPFWREGDIVTESGSYSETVGGDDG